MEILRFVVATVVSTIDPIVLGAGIVIGICMERDMRSWVLMMGVFSAIGLLVLAVNGGRQGELFYAFAQIVAIWLDAGVTFGIARALQRKSDTRK